MQTDWLHGKRSELGRLSGDATGILLPLWYANINGKRVASRIQRPDISSRSSLRPDYGILWTFKMKFRTEIVRIGELLGPIDFGYDFLSHFQGYCTSDEVKKSMCDKRVALLKQLADQPDANWWVCSSGGYWHKMLSVGMYDGWPYWKPNPAICFNGTLGSEWMFFDDLMDIKKK